MNDTKMIPLTKGYSAIVDAVDYEWLRSFSWYYTFAGYAAHGAKKNGKRHETQMHREILKPPQFVQVEHINGNKLDNRRENLRILDSKSLDKGCVLTGRSLRRFQYKVDANNCWVWQKAISSTGYGSFYYDGRVQRAHRISYMHYVGPIPDNLVLDHLCRNKACVNPAHLEVVTHKTNVLRGIGPSANNAKKTACPRGHEYTPENSVLRRDGKFCKVCKSAFAARNYQRTRIKKMANWHVRTANKASSRISPEHVIEVEGGEVTFP